MSENLEEKVCILTGRGGGGGSAKIYHTYKITVSKISKEHCRYCTIQEKRGEGREGLYMSPQPSQVIGKEIR